MNENKIPTYTDIELIKKKLKILKIYLKNIIGQQLMSQENL